MNEARPNKPKEAMKIASPVNSVKTWPETIVLVVLTIEEFIEEEVIDRVAGE